MERGVAERQHAALADAEQVDALDAVALADRLDEAVDIANDTE